VLAISLFQAVAWTIIVGLMVTMVVLLHRM
jgi:hypothetical protein